MLNKCLQFGVVYIFRSGPNRRDQTEGIKFGLDQDSLNVMLMFYYLQKFRHLIYRWTMTLTRVPHAISYKEKFSPKEAAELATLQFNK